MGKLKEGENMVVGVVFHILIKNVGANWGRPDVDRTRESLSLLKSSPREIYLACWRAPF